MRLHRFMGDFDLESEAFSIHDTDLLSQWRTVLRLKAGDHAILADGRGTEAEVSISSLEKNLAKVSVLHRENVHREPAKDVTLYAALLRRENFELIAQKATEIGVIRIVPILTSRTVKTGFNRIRLEKIIREACEQSGRTYLPSLSEPMALAEALATCDPDTSVMFDVPDSPEEQAALPKETTACFVGPEGGFSPEEVTLAKERGIRIASLGTLTLRAETAAIVASFLCCNN